MFRTVGCQDGLEGLAECFGTRRAAYQEGGTLESYFAAVLRPDEQGIISQGRLECQQRSADTYVPACSRFPSSHGAEIGVPLDVK